MKREDTGGEASSASIHEKNITISPTRVTTNCILLTAQLYNRVEAMSNSSNFSHFFVSYSLFPLIVDILTTNLLTE